MNGRTATFPAAVVLLLANLVLGLAAPAWAPAAETESGRWLFTATARSLGYRDLREPKTFTPSTGFVAEHPGWTRYWSERRAYVTAAYKLIDADTVVLTPGFHLGTAVGRFEARNRGIGYYEAWETKPAFLWGPSCDLLWRQGPQGGLFALLRYELFLAAAPEGFEDVSSASGTATPPSARDAFFSWTSHEATLALGYDWGKVAMRAGLTLTAFRLDKRLTHHIDPAGATGNALAAILALNSIPSRYAYEPASPFAPYLAVTFRPLSRLALEASLRPGVTPDVGLSLAVTF
jgi:hypothetical protein